jgi:hypothetical protein
MKGPLATADVRSLFTEEIERMGGTVRDAYDDGTRLFLRAVLPETSPVRHDDRMQSGVALRMDSQQICVHPYIFRLVCENGAIMAQALQTRRIEYIGVLSPEQIETRLSEAIRACGAKEAFQTAVGEIRTTLEQEADMVMSLMPLLSRLPVEQASEMVARIMGEYHEARDRSLFGLMNAVTAVARETTDPETRWDLEEYGGGMALALLSSPVRDDSAARSWPDLCEAMPDEAEELLRSMASVAYDREELTLRCGAGTGRMTRSR